MFLDSWINSFSSRSRRFQPVGRKPRRRAWARRAHLSLEFLEGRVVLTGSPYVVCNVNDSGPGSLREAILDANGDMAASVVQFNIPGSGVHTIQPTSALPAVTGQVEIDGTTQPGYGGSPLIELNGVSAGSVVSGLVLASPNITVMGLAINGFSGDGIDVTGGNDIVQSCYIGTDPTGSVAVPNGGNGVSVSSTGNSIGGLTSTPGTAAGNVISGNGGNGIELDAGSNLVQGNIVGLNAPGNAIVSNGSAETNGLFGGEDEGIHIVGSSNNTIGGATAGASNVVSGNHVDGVQITGDSATGNHVEGNYIGTDITGTIALGNAYSGVSDFNGASGNTLGGSAPGAGNLISGNGGGIFIASANDLLIQGNYVGTNAAGSAALGNLGNGIAIFGGSTNVTIGGTTAGARNVISGNGQASTFTDGILVSDAGTSNNLIVGNFIGMDATGTVSIANGWDGINIAVGASSNTVGGTVVAARNIISGNGQNGVEFFESGSGNVVEGNYIGTDVTGSYALGRQVVGISYGAGSSGNIFGGSDPGAGNLVSGNTFCGIFNYSPDSPNNLIEGNGIGTNAAGTAAVPNVWVGISVQSGYNTIGGTTPGARNVIFGNNTGIELDSSNNVVEGNVISGNTSTGIQLNSSNNVVEGNYVGTNAAGSAALGNGNGIVDSSGGNTIGGATATPGTGAGNVISGNHGRGIWLNGASNDSVQGNLIGTNASGTAVIGNGDNDIEIAGNATWNTIGGSAVSDRNIIVGSGYVFGSGVEFDGAGPDNNVVANNYIGTDITGMVALGNVAAGVQLFQVPGHNTIGLPGAGNLISGNGYVGINIGGSTNTLVQGNRIGTNAAGTASLANGWDGILVSSGANTIGGTAVGAGNIIFGNRGNGIELDSSANLVEGNIVGTNATGTVAPGYTLGASGAISGDSAVTLNGSSGYVPLPATAFGAYPTSGSTNSYSRTFEVWFNAPVGSSGGVILGQTISGSTPGGAGPGGWVPAVMLGKDGKIHTSLFWHANTDFISSTSTYNDGLWHALDVTYSNGTETLYIDGTAVASNIGTENSYASAYSYYLGTGYSNGWAGGNGGWFSFNGRLDEAATFATALSPSQIAAHYGAAASGFAAYSAAVLADSPTAYYHLDETSGTIAHDSSGGGLNAAYVTNPTALANGGSGIYVTAAHNTIGGTVAGARNVISGNAANGIELDSGNNLVEGNFIGTNVTGTVAVPNQGNAGIFVTGADNTIGGLTSTPGTGAGNVISGNTSYGVLLAGSAASGNLVEGNLIGTTATGTGALGNGAVGVLMGGASANTVGGTSPGARNVISANVADGVEMFSNADNNLVAGNYVGTDITGTFAIGNQGVGVGADTNSNGNTIGGTTAGARNLISGNGAGLGIFGVTGTQVEGNYIGTDATGTRALGNQAGAGVLVVGGDNTSIGSSTPGGGNLISGNVAVGVGIFGASDTQVLGNFIGTDVTGTVALGNGIGGVQLGGTNNTTIGGVDAGSRNIISGNNNWGIGLFDGPTNTLIEGNYIGTDVTGTHALGNIGNGIQPGGCDHTTIGGVTAGARNIISGNTGSGIGVFGGSTNTLIEGNYIGTDVTGTHALGNIVFDIIVAGADHTTVGGVVGGARNIISSTGNTGAGIGVFNSDTTNTLIAGNYIGTDVTGTHALGNGFFGINVAGAGSNTTIGSSTPGGGNLISGNFIGVGIFSVTGTVVIGNLIGTDPSGMNALGNTVSGLFIGNGATNSIIGGVTPGAGNTIAFSGGVGVLVFSANTVDNSIRGNSIHDNQSLGIDLTEDLFADDGVTLNDSAGHIGPNNFQNFPVITSVSEGPTPTVTGTLHSTPNQSFAIDFYANPTADPSGYGEGQYYLGSASVATDASGNASFVANLSASNLPGGRLLPGWVVSATATDSANNTSEFSQDTPDSVIIILDPTASGALSVTGHSVLTENAPIAVDSSSPTALQASGNAQVTAKSILVVGGVQRTGNAALNPTPTTGSAATADPLASLAAPAATTPPGSVNLSGQSSLTINPGIYTQISVSGNAQLTLNPGIYVIAGGGLTVTGNATVIGTSGVLIYNAGNNYPNPGGSYGSITLSGNAYVMLTAQATGPYAGISIFQARDNAQPMTLSGGALFGSRGVLYLPVAALVLSGNSNLSAPLVVGRLSLSGNADPSPTLPERRSIAFTATPTPLTQTPATAQSIGLPAAMVSTTVTLPLPTIASSSSIEPVTVPLPMIASSSSIEPGHALLFAVSSSAGPISSVEMLWAGSFAEENAPWLLPPAIEPPFPDSAPAVLPIVPEVDAEVDVVAWLETELRRDESSTDLASAFLPESEPAGPGWAVVASLALMTSWQASTRREKPLRRT